MQSIFRKISRRIARLAIKLYQSIRIFFYRIASLGVDITGHPYCAQPLLLHGAGKIYFGENVKIGFFPSPLFFGHSFVDARGENSVIQFGKNIHINNGLTIISEASKIKIGNNVLIGPNVTIFDSDFHGIKAEDRNNSKKILRGDVTIEDDVFIGMGVILLKGVTVGKGSVIAANAVVTNSVEPNVIAGGNPARKLRAI